MVSVPTACRRAQWFLPSADLVPLLILQAVCTTGQQQLVMMYAACVIIMDAAVTHGHSVKSGVVAVPALCCTIPPVGASQWLMCDNGKPMWMAACVGQVFGGAQRNGLSSSGCQSAGKYMWWLQCLKLAATTHSVLRPLCPSAMVTSKGKAQLIWYVRDFSSITKCTTAGHPTVLAVFIGRAQLA
jgi:hypothetical protein